MTSALVFSSGPPGAHTLASDLEAVGIQVLASVHERGKLVQEVVRHAPDVVICEEPLPGAALFEALQAVAATSPCPVIVFTSDGDVGNITRATEVGVHAYVVNGYGQARLRSLIHLAIARFGRERALRAQMLELSTRFEERKMVDRAKGILMRARQVSDDDAFQILRMASMHSNQRLGQVSQHIIHSARFAEDVNRSGQLRMLSQRLVKLALLQVAGVQAVPAGSVKDCLAASVSRVDTNIAALGKSLSQPTFGDLLGQVARTWSQLKSALQAGPQAGTMAQLDALAEQLLQEAERLTSSLENAGAVPPLQVLNLAGRQRMLCQRFAKYALLQQLGDKAGNPRHAEEMAKAGEAFEQALRRLDALPLSSREIRAALDLTRACWTSMLAGAAPATRPAGRERVAGLESLATASEDVLDVLEQLSVHYERSMQMLVA